MRRSAEFGAALGCDLLGAAGALLAATQTWQVVRVFQPHPLPDEVLSVSGRAVDAGIAALAVVALAGVVAVLAARGVARRAVGVVLALAGAAMVWRAVTASSPVSADRARALVQQHHPGASIAGGGHPQVTTSAAWPALTVICGVLILVAGALVTWHGHRWANLGARYERQPAEPDADVERARAAASMWNALDHGNDPTAAARDDADPDQPR